MKKRIFKKTNSNQKKEITDDIKIKTDIILTDKTKNKIKVYTPQSEYQTEFFS